MSSTPVKISGLIAGMAGLVSAENFVQILNFPRPSALQAILITGAIILTGVIIAVYEAGRRAKAKNETKRSSETAFNLKISELGLNEDEKKTLEKMAGAEQYTELNNILRSVDIFEQHIEQEAQQLIALPDPARKNEAEETLASLRKKLHFNYLDNDHPLASTRNISPGQPMMLLTRNGKTPVIHEVRVTGNKELSFRVQYNTDLEPSISLRRGDRLKAVFPRHGDAMYEIELAVAGFDRPGWIDFYHTLNISRRQLRRDVRLDVNFPLKLRVLETKDSIEKERLGNMLLSARISDISGGGLAFTLDNPLKPEDILSLNFSLAETPVTGIQARLLRVNPQQGRDEMVFKHHMQYVGIDPIQKERIVKFVFEKLRQKKQQTKE